MSNPIPPLLPRVKPPPLWRETLAEHDELVEGDQLGNQPIGGWLILFALGRVLAPFFLGPTVIKSISILLNARTWSLLTTPGTRLYHPLWATALTYEAGGNIILLLYSLILIYLFFARRRAFPPLMVAYQITVPFFYLGDYLIGMQIPAVSAHHSGDQIGPVVGGVVGALVWVPYLLTSVRVRRTFVR